LVWVEMPMWSCAFNIFYPRGSAPPGWGMGHLICLFTLIINIYGLGLVISTIIKFTSGRGWGMTPQGLSYKAFNLPSQFFVLWNLMISWIVFILHRKIFPIHHTYIYSLVSYLFIKQDQMILTCNSAVASLMLSRFFYY
jgi:hypothetical protein